MFGQKNEQKKQKLELVRNMLEFHGELVNRVTKVCEEYALEMPRKYNMGFDTKYPGVFFVTPDNLLVEYTPDDDIDSKVSEIRIYFGDKVSEQQYIYRGSFSRNRPFVIGELKIQGRYVRFPRLDKIKWEGIKEFSGTPEEMRALGYLFEQTKTLVPFKTSLKAEDRKRA